ncbi:MAG: DUF1330 domain-containing protein [Rhodospirillales bacterium]|nr:DUF1330 domain-containing protein [Rhodospirillales bacterium]MDE2575575.1 DUF1330 domain-containing protein [Rhodospirillales bacterium]
MPAYMIVNVTLTDAAAYENYKARVPTIIARHGGEYLVRGGPHEVLEGTWQPSRLVLFRFPDRAAIHAFMNDPDYAPLKAVRQSAAITDAVAVDGIA